MTGVQTCALPIFSLLEEQGIVCKGIHIVASSGMLNLLYRKPDPVESSLPGSRHMTGKKRSGSSSAKARSSQTDTDNSENPDFPAPEQIAGDYVRPGIVLYGMLSSRPDSDVWREFVRPVLSLKARITSIRMLYAGEAAGYGLAFTAEQDMRIATIAIGYADGLPRELSNGKGGVLIDGCRAPIIGRICMDQTIVDVSHIPHIRPGDIAVIIGKSGTQEITADALAQQCATISNETLTRLGARLERKFQEQYLAVKLELTLTEMLGSTRAAKEQIITDYLNTINLGNNTLGVKVAARRYFNKDVSDLTLSECAVIAGITQNPAHLNPISGRERNEIGRAHV